jgi:hypothetical protein
VVLGHVDVGLRPLAGIDLAGEEDVDLAVRATLVLGEEEEGDDEAAETGAAPDVAALAAEISALEVDVSMMVVRGCTGGFIGLTSGLSIQEARKMQGMLTR